MRFYKFEFNLKPPSLFPEPGQECINSDITHTEWFGSEREAVVRRLELFKGGKLLGKKKDHEIWPVDIDTSKFGLLAFLQRECV